MKRQDGGKSQVRQDFLARIGWRQGETCRARPRGACGERLVGIPTSDHPSDLQMPQTIADDDHGGTPCQAARTSSQPSPQEVAEHPRHLDPRCLAAPDLTATQHRPDHLRQIQTLPRFSLSHATEIGVQIPASEPIECSASRYRSTRAVRLESRCNPRLLPCRRCHAGHRHPWELRELQIPPSFMPHAEESANGVVARP